MTDTLNETQIDSLLSTQLIGRIGCHADGITYIVPVSYAYDGGSIYIHTYEGMKLSLMRDNPDVCFEVDDIVDTANWQSVIAWGSFEEIKEASERIKAYSILSKRILPLNSSVTTHLGADWPFSNEALQDIDGIVIRIRITKKTGRFESNIQTPSYSF